MSLFDALDGIFMSRRLRLGVPQPIRKVYYNLTVTVLSVLVALVIGVIVLAGLLVDRLGIESGPLAMIGSADLEFVGFMIAGMFVVAWLVAGGVDGVRSRVEEAPDAARKLATAQQRVLDDLRRERGWIQYWPRQPLPAVWPRLIAWISGWISDEA